MVCQSVEPAAVEFISSRRDRSLPQGLIAKNERGHGFDNRDRARQHTWIVPASGSEGRFLAGRSDSFLFARDRRSGFERDPKQNVFAVADSALHATGMVRRRMDCTGA